jgi:hypothetical protein
VLNGMYINVNGREKIRVLNKKIEENGYVTWIG